MHLIRSLSHHGVLWYCTVVHGMNNLLFLICPILYVAILYQDTVEKLKRRMLGLVLNPLRALMSLQYKVVGFIPYRLFKEINICQRLGYFTSKQ